MKETSNIGLHLVMCILHTCITMSKCLKFGKIIIISPIQALQ